MGPPEPEIIDQSFNTPGNGWHFLYDFIVERIHRINRTGYPDFLWIGIGECKQVHPFRNQKFGDDRNYDRIVRIVFCWVWNIFLVHWFRNPPHNIRHIYATKIRIVKDLLKDLVKAFENKTRLGIMSALMVNDYLDFSSLKELLDVTDGNLASHLKLLEKGGFVTVRKEFLDRKPNTKYFATEIGKETFIRHIRAIEKLIQ
ncbi:MAG: transcriptional regulator [Cyclobacteriaceae bacterium]|nr:transcriptional regulator [Cyclobacteriaceae bacterium]